MRPLQDRVLALAGVVQAAALAKSVFPLGALLKREVRQLAREAGFANHAKKDSTGICFVGERRFAEFLGKYLPAQPGDIETPEGRKLGTHQGLMYYTLGQRQGIGIGGRRDAEESPWYVASKDLARNVLVVVQGHDHPLLLHSALTATDMHWVSGRPPATPLQCAAKARYRQEDQACTLDWDGAANWQASFERPQRAVTPGQYAVFYSGDECLGGGVIVAAQACSPESAAELRSAG